MTDVGAGDVLPSPAAFYDDLAAAYHRLYPDWHAAVDEQAEALDGLLAARMGDGPHRILDCAAGVGTQMLGLLRRGHRMWGTDLSAGALARARAECGDGAVQARVAVADMRRLPFLADRFDAVVCADNALAHLLSVEDATRALREMARVARPGGLVVASVRDYRVARRDRVPGTLPQVHHGPDGRTIAFQVWDWHPDGRRYDLEHVTLTPAGDSWSVTTRRARMRAFTRAELVGCARRAGLLDVAWLGPERTGFFQPLVVGSAPA